MPPKVASEAAEDFWPADAHMNKVSGSSISLHLISTSHWIVPNTDCAD